MRRTIRRIRQGSGRGEEGVALITVMLSLLALTALSVAIVDYGIGSQNLSRRDQNWNAAFSAAEAGVNDYLNRINNSPNYASTYGTEVGQTVDANNPAMAATTEDGSDWAVVPGTTDTKFRYWVDSTANDASRAKSGSVKVTVTGKVGNAARTVETELRVLGYLDFLYFTDLEIMDPALDTGQPPLCTKPNHAYAQPPKPAYPDTCTLITFVGNTNRQDVINGPLHTNDLMRVCGNPRFNAPASTSYPGYEPELNEPVEPGDPLWVELSSCGTSSVPEFQGNSPKTNLTYADPILPLPGNDELKKYTGHPGGVETGGCRYKGPTKIVFNGDMLTVTSPNSKKGKIGANCPLGATAKKGPANGVIYVNKSKKACNDANGNGVGYPKPGDETTTYSCKAGDAFVEGTVKGQITIGANNDIVVTDDLVYEDKTLGSTSYQGTNLLGLIANRFVVVYHPYTASGANHSDVNTDPYIDAAILSVLHSFYVQNWGDGDPLGDLTVFGAIAQEYRGPVGTFYSASGNSASGYKKVYDYDNRLQYLEPPYFLTPSSTEFEQSTFKELTPRLS